MWYWRGSVRFVLASLDAGFVQVTGGVADLHENSRIVDRDWAHGVVSVAGGGSVVGHGGYIADESTARLLLLLLLSLSLCGTHAPFF